MILRSYHRGAYEHLWAEQKFAVIAVSQKSFQSGCGKLGRRPHILALLGLLAGSRKEEKTERNHAWLNVYDQLKSRLARDERRHLIEDLLAGNPAALEKLYELTLIHQEKSLFGCRLFYPRSPIYKFWDFGDLPGLWLCLGPYLINLEFAELAKRLAMQAAIGLQELEERLDILSRGLKSEVFETWSPKLIFSLLNHGAVAQVGAKVWLHPRMSMCFSKTRNLGDFSASEYSAQARQKHDATVGSAFEAAALLALERCWDSDPSDIPRIPDFEIWKTEFNSDNIVEIEWEKGSSPQEAYEFLIKSFSAQADAERGKTAQLDLSTVKTTHRNEDLPEEDSLRKE